MKVIDFKLNQIIHHPTRGVGIVLFIGQRKLSIKWPHSRQDITFESKHVEFEISEL